MSFSRLDLAWFSPVSDLHGTGFRRITNKANALVSTWEPGVSQGWARGEPGVSQGWARGEPGVSQGWKDMLKDLKERKEYINMLHWWPVGLRILVIFQVFYLWCMYNGTPMTTLLEGLPATARGRGQVDICQLAKPEPKSYPVTQHSWGTARGEH